MGIKVKNAGNRICPLLSTTSIKTWENGYIQTTPAIANCETENCMAWITTKTHEESREEQTGEGWELKYSTCINGTKKLWTKELDYNDREGYCSHFCKR